MSRITSDYYQKVNQYYNVDAADFEKRYNQNGILQDIRKAFQKIVERYQFTSAIEIGFGPGIDLEYFSKKYQERSFFGIDISSEMTAITQYKIITNNLKNCSVKQGSVEDIKVLFPDQTFDMVYVFFGALNTVEDLDKVVDDLAQVGHQNTTYVLTFVNKYYLLGSLLFLLKGQFKMAFKRFKKKWGGYSNEKFLESQCYSFKDIKKTFGKTFTFVEKQGFSILAPPWFFSGLKHKLRFLYPLLLKCDQLLSKTMCWQFGEYSLYVMKKK